MIPFSLATATVYQGSLQYTPPLPVGLNDGLMVTGPANQWTSYTVTMSWTVDDSVQNSPNPLYPVKYEYRFQHSGTQYGFSHIIIESSTNFTAGNITGVSGAIMDSVKLQTVLGGNPAMPENVYGIRFNPLTSGVIDWSFSFYSDRLPVWGDFYGRCGGAGGINSAYNQGFTISDVDPTAAPSNGSVANHILRPDTVVPEPAAMALFGLGGLLLSRKRKA